MRNDWKEALLGDVLELKRGYDLPQKTRKDGNIPVVSSSGISGIHNEAKVTGENVVTGRYGTIGKVFYYKEPIWPLNTTLYVKDFKGSDPLFVSYFLKTIDFLSCSDKAAVPGVNRNHLHKIPIYYPPLPEQKAIAHILGSLDDKIELNRQMNQSLEQMAQALFKSWFVDFDPVLDNALAANKPIPDALKAKAEKRKGILAKGKPKTPEMEAVAGLFPSEFVFSEELGRWIPLGWEAKKFSSIAEVKYGKDHKKLNDGDIPVYGSGGLMRKVNQSLHTGESVLIPRKGTLTNIMYVNETFWSVDTMFFTKIILPKHAKYLFYCLKLLDFNDMNVGSAVPSMTTKVLNNLDILLPNSKIVEKFDDFVQDYYLRKDENEAQIQSLTNLRDTLLPKLISGEVRVPEEMKSQFTNK